MKKNINTIRFFKLIVLFVIFFIFPLFVFSENEIKKTVVLISSFDKNDIWTQKCYSAFEDRMKKAGYIINVKPIYLNSATITNLKKRKYIFKHYFSDIKEKVDAIVAFDYEASDFVLRYTDSIINKIPIIFVSELELDRKIEYKNVNGIICDYGIIQNYILALKIFPKTKKIYVWADKSNSGKFFLNQAKLQLKGYENHIEIEYGLDAKNKKELIEKCKHIESNSIIIFGIWQMDDEGRVYDASELYPEIVKSTSTPIFTSIDDLYLGFIGGYVQSSKNNGMAAAEKVIRLFQGEKIENMHIDYLNPIPIFNITNIKKKGGNYDVIPYDAEKLTSFSMFVKGNLIWIIFASIIIIFLVIVIFQRKKVNRFDKEIKIKEETEKNLKFDLKLLSFALPSLNTISWYYNEQDDKFYYGDYVKNVGVKFSARNGIEDVLNFVHKNDKEKFLGFFKDILESEESKEFSLVYQGTYPYVYDIMWWECRGMVEIYEDKQGKHKLIYGININISKYKEIEKELSDALDKSINSDKLKTAFLANIRHEIRTPLNAIVGFSDLLIETNDPVEKKEYANIIKKNQDNLLKLVADIIDLSLLESGNIQINRIKFDLVQYFNETISIFQHKLNEGVELTCYCPNKSCIIEFDKTRLTQIITHYIHNAIKFTNRGYIKVGYEVIDNGIKFYCEDSGIGIKQEYLPKVFERFEKLNSFEQGTGLGLAICKAIVELSGGKYGVESKEGEGSFFWFWIPCNVIIIDDEKQKDINIEIEYSKDKKPNIEE